MEYNTNLKSGNNATNKQGVASKDTLIDFNNNEARFDKLAVSCRQSFIKKYGNNIFDDFYLPENFDLNLFASRIKKSEIYNSKAQEMAMPFDNNKFKLFINAPKKLINHSITTNVKGLYIETYLVLSKINNKNTLFTLSITRHKEYDFSKLNIKLDFWVKGKTWLPIARIDTAGFSHPNYFSIDGKTAKNVSSIEFVKTPHMHLNSFEAEILHCNRLNYLPAKEIDIDTTNYAKSDRRILNTYLEYMFNEFNISMIKEDEDTLDDYYEN